MAPTRVFLTKLSDQSFSCKGVGIEWGTFQNVRAEAIEPKNDMSLSRQICFLWQSRDLLGTRVAGPCERIIANHKFTAQLEVEFSQGKRCCEEQLVAQALGHSRLAGHQLDSKP